MPDASTTQELQRVLDRLNAGDTDAKKELIELAYQRMVRLAGRMRRFFPGGEEESTGVFHEAYLRVNRALDQVDSKPTSVRQFMGLVALQIRRVLLDSMRKIKGRGPSPRPMKVQSLFHWSGTVADAYPQSPATEYLAGQEQALSLDVVEAIERLDEAEREVVELLFFLGCTQPEAAEVLGVHEDTVKRRWGKAKKELTWLLHVYQP
jgi:RNA polymerase sigma factor (sigma-70 family)